MLQNVRISMPIATTRTCNQDQEGEAPDLGHTGVVALLPGAQKVDAIKCIVILNHGHFGFDVMELTANWVKVPRAKVLLWLYILSWIPSHPYMVREGLRWSEML